jgi:RNA polymerase sigma-70 factor (ECF subfamily)
MEHASDNDIIARVNAGAADEFEYLVRRYQGALFRIVGNLVKGPAVEDLVQDIFMAAFANLQRFEPGRGSFRTWIYRIARNRALNASKKKREQQIDKTMVIADSRTPCHALIVKQAFDRLDRTLDELTFKERLIFVLSELEGLSYAEIARIERVPLGTVKSRLYRVKDKLRRALEPYME